MDLKETLDHLASLVQQDLQASKVERVSQARMETTAKLETQERQEILDLQDKWVLQELMGNRDLKVVPVNKVQQVCQERRVTEGDLGLQVLQVLLALRVNLDHRDYQAFEDHLDLLATLEHLVKKVQLVSQVMPVNKVPMERRVLEVAEVLRGIVVPLALLDQREILERRVNLA